MKRISILKFTLIFSLIFMMYACNSGNTSLKKQDEKAILLLQQVQEAVQKMDKKSFTVTVDEEKLNSEGKVINEHAVNLVKAISPNKFLVDHVGDKANFTYVYNGEYFTYYSIDDNNYVTLEAPATTAAMIDSMHNNFGFKFPAGDFFYPSFKEDIEEYFNKIQLKGNESIDDEVCEKIIAKNKEVDVKIWISEETSLPKKLEVVYKNENNITYSAVFNDWDLSPDFDDLVFDFVAPENSRLIRIMSKN